MNVKTRLEQFCEHRKLLIGGFCREARISNSYFSNVKGEMGIAIKGKIKEAFPDLNIDWLITGVGDMLNPPTVQAATMAPYPAPNITTGDVTGNGNSFVAGNNNTVQPTPEVIVAEVAPSGEVVPIKQPVIVPDKIVRDPNTDVLEWVSDTGSTLVNKFNIARIWHNTDFIISMNNSAMAPALYQNELVFLKEFAEGSEIIDGEIYGIETRSRGILIRFLYNDDDAYITRPKNTREYSMIRIPKEQVIRLYEPVFHGATHLSSIPDTEGEMAKQISQQDKYISSLIDQVGASVGEIIKQGARTDRLIEQNAELIKKIIEK